MTYHIVYKTTNTVNGKFYIGKHKCSSLEFDGYLGSGSVLKAAIKKYGEESFSRETLAVFESANKAAESERNYVSPEYLNSHRGVCYNVAIGGYGGFTIDEDGRSINVAQLPHIREKLRISSLEVHNRPDVVAKKRAANLGERNPQFGKKMTDSQKNKLSESLKGKEKSTETRARISASLTGRSVPPEIGRKISAALKGRTVPDYQKEKMSVAQTGRKHPNSVKEKISNSHIGMTYPDKTCPCCGLVGSGGNMTRYHFDNCKQKVFA